MRDARDNNAENISEIGNFLKRLKFKLSLLKGKLIKLSTVIFSSDKIKKYLPSPHAHLA